MNEAPCLSLKADIEWNQWIGMNQFFNAEGLDLRLLHSKPHLYQILDIERNI
jgi:hypothetical protein